MPKICRCTPAPQHRSTATTSIPQSARPKMHNKYQKHLRKHLTGKKIGKNSGQGPGFGVRTAGLGLSFSQRQVANAASRAPPDHLDFSTCHYSFLKYILELKCSLAPFLPSPSFDTFWAANNRLQARYHGQKQAKSYGAAAVIVVESRFPAIFLGQSQPARPRV